MLLILTKLVCKINLFLQAFLFMLYDAASMLFRIEMPSKFDVTPFKSICLKICSGVNSFFLSLLFAFEMIAFNATQFTKLLLNAAFAILSESFSDDIHLYCGLEINSILTKFINDSSNSSDCCLCTCTSDSFFL
jgi:hypothetical protein